MKVLIADDSPAHLLALRKAVSGLGHDCVSAKDGDEAWKLFLSDRPEVVISDWVMPGIEGDELCRRIRDVEGAYCYVIVLSSLDDKKHVMSGMKSGADDYLTKPLDADDLEARLAAAVRVTALHRRLAEQQGELERLNQELAELARRDPLMGIGNRMRMHEDLERIEREVDSSGSGYSVLLCDIDHFKSYNDANGHQRGDDVLRKVADALAKGTRGEDAVYRYGGEELLVLVRSPDPAVAVSAGERLRQSVEALAEPRDAAGEGVVTISVGAAVREAGGDGGSEDAVRRADAALYRAKDEGRNRVVADHAVVTP
jgi:two-component system chemotaxis response regulator CheY